MKKGLKFYASLAMFVWSVISVITISVLTFTRSWNAGQYAVLIFMIAAYTLIGGITLRSNLLRKGA